MVSWRRDARGLACLGQWGEPLLHLLAKSTGHKLVQRLQHGLLQRLSPLLQSTRESLDRLSRLTASDWERLKADLAARKVRVVALDLPTSWVMTTGNGDEFTARMFDAINGMLLDMLAAVARKDYDDRRRRQEQGQAKAKAEGRYKGRPEDTERNDGIASMLAAKQSWSSIQAATGCSRATIAKIAKRAKVAA